MISRRFSHVIKAFGLTSTTLGVFRAAATVNVVPHLARYHAALEVSQMLLQCTVLEQFSLVTVLLPLPPLYSSPQCLNQTFPDKQ